MFIKQSFAILVFLIVGIVGKSQKTERVAVSGKLEFAGYGKRILNVTYRKMGHGFQFDSVVVSNGEFKFEKELTEPIVAVMSLKAEQRGPSNNQGVLDYISIFLMPGEVRLLASDNLRTAQVTGTGAGANPDYQDYLRQGNLYIDTMNRANSALRNISDSAKRIRRMTEVADSIKLLRDKNVYLRFLMSKPQSPVAALAILEYSGEPVWTPRGKMKPEEIEKLLRPLPKNIASYPSLVNLKDELAVSKSTGAGRPIIDFTMEDTSGKKVRLSDFKGQYVFLDFWASWCVPCRKENPNVKRQFEKYKDKGFTVVSVSLDKPDAKQAWLNAIRKDEINMWTHLSDLNGFESKAAKDYYVKSIPTNFLIGPDGKFLGRNLYGDALSKALALIFQ